MGNSGFKIKNVSFIGETILDRVEFKACFNYSSFSKVGFRFLVREG